MTIRCFISFHMKNIKSMQLLIFIEEFHSILAIWFISPELNWYELAILHAVCF